ncbi:hypothetical protein D3C85_322490 [compost metagenome]
MGRFGVTELLIFFPILGFLFYLSYRTAFRYGKTAGRNEVFEEQREKERKEKKRLKKIENS